MLSFKRGDTPTFVFDLGETPLGSLGEPIAVISQEDFTAYLDVEIDVDANKIMCSLDYEDSVMLVGGFPAYIQHTWTDDAGNSFTYPPEEVYIEPAYIPFDPKIKDMSDTDDTDDTESLEEEEEVEEEEEAEQS